MEADKTEIGMGFAYHSMLDAPKDSAAQSVHPDTYQDRAQTPKPYGAPWFHSATQTIHTHTPRRRPGPEPYGALWVSLGRT